MRDAEAVGARLARLEPEVVLHLAAQPIVRRSYRDPAETFAVNVMGTVNVLDAVRASDTVRAVVVVTSDKCYENRGLDRGYREDEPLGGSDPYSASKACQELVAQAYRRSFGMPIATARAGNVIGGGDFAEDRLVPDAMRAALAGEPVRVRNPDAVRPVAARAVPARGLPDAGRAAALGDGLRRGLELRPARRGRAGRWAGSSTGWRSCGRAACRSRTRAPRTPRPRRARCTSTRPAPASGSAGARRGSSTARSRRSWTGTPPTPPAPTCGRRRSSRSKRALYAAVC